MLTLTPAAAEAVTDLLDRPEVPDGAGLRLQRGVDSRGEAALGIVIVTEPEPEDQLVPAGDETTIFLAPEVVELLSDQVLDAEVRDENFSFSLRKQQPEAD